MQFIKSLLVLIIIGLFTSSLYAQLDSVWHQGPSSNFVLSGSIQTTDNFGDSFDPLGSEIKSTPFMEAPPLFENYLENDGSPLPEYVYIEDANATKNPTLNPENTVLLSSFPGPGATGFIPPDPHLAVGPNHIIAAVNSQFRIYDKEGNTLKIISAGAWFAPVSPNENGDPQVMYDHFANRWFLLFMGLNTSSQQASNLIAYSDDDNPLGDWYIYELDTKKHGTVNSNTWGDYPQIGYDEEGIYIMTRLFGFSAGFFGSKIRIIDKTQLYASNGGRVDWTDIWNIRRPGSGSSGEALDVIHPVNSYTAGSGAWFVWASRTGANYYSMFKILNPLSSAPRIRGKVIIVSPGYGMAPNAQQLGGGQPLEANGSHMKTAPVLRDGLIFATHSIANSTSSAYASTKYFIFNINTLTIDEQAELGAIGYYYIYPTITADIDHNIGVTFSRSATTEYVGAYYSSKQVGDPPGLEPSQPLAEGQSNYQIIAGGRNRWGDYLGICIDPENFYDIWMLSEYATASGSWATWIGEIKVGPYGGVHLYANPGIMNIGDVEVGTTSGNATILIANYGDQDLVITDIPSSVGDFNLESNLSFPITLSSFDSLEIDFSFSPTAPGDTTVEYTISSNDPNFSGFTLTGNGYSMYPALDKTIYASTGSQNNGDILKIDKTTGTGTTVGSSLFSSIKDITIHPTTGIMYGLVVHSGDADIVRVSAAGDAYLLFTIAIPSMAGIAFNTTGTLYGITSGGDINTIDLSNGTTTFVVTGQGSYSSLTFHPITNELWATSRSFVPPNKDAVFTVDLSTGDTTIIGHTGLGEITNDVVFDEGGNLYGVIGSASSISDFISIDATNGVGTVVGSVGYKNILGLAFEETGVTAVEDDVNGTVPMEFSLSQNYPNPFNPTTTIQFSLPVNSDVKLVVYNMLGQEVATLLNEQRSTGTHNIIWNSSNTNGVNLSSGIYFYKLNAVANNGKEFQQIRKMVLLK